MDKRPLISICIPTYNRALILQSTLQHFVENPEFNEEVELIISDNCSTDATSEVGMKFAVKYENIYYYKNDKNIEDANFVKVLDYGNGEYLKLLNDTVYIDEEDLRFVKLIIKKYHGMGIPIFFSNNWIFTTAKKNIITCHNVDEYMRAISTWVTSNNIFGVWREDWVKIQNKQQYAQLKLQQVDWSYRIVHNHNGCIIFDREILKKSKHIIMKKCGYNWFEIHLINYYKILQPYVDRGEITYTTLRQDKHYLLRHFASALRRTYHMSYKRGWNFDTKGTWSMLMQHYKNDPYFYFFICTLPFQKHI